MQKYYRYEAGCKDSTGHVQRELLLATEEVLVFVRHLATTSCELCLNLFHMPDEAGGA